MSLKVSIYRGRPRAWHRGGARREVSQRSTLARSPQSRRPLSSTVCRCLDANRMTPVFKRPNLWVPRCRTSPQPLDSALLPPGWITLPAPAGPSRFVGQALHHSIRPHPGPKSFPHALDLGLLVLLPAPIPVTRPEDRSFVPPSFTPEYSL